MAIAVKGKVVGKAPARTAGAVKAPMKSPNPSTASKEKIELKRCRTPIFRASFTHLFKAHTGFEGQEPMYSVVALFPKNTDLGDMKKAIVAAATEKWGPREKWPKNFKNPFRDGNEKGDLDGYKDMFFVNFKSKQRPGLINQALEYIDEESGQFYAGCYARATVTAFAYSKAGNNGVSFFLQNVQKCKDGVPFSGRKAAHEEFDAVEDSSDNPADYEEEVEDEIEEVEEEIVEEENSMDV